ncbi:hypothetical protein GCM10011414_13180 [Croceivirga lutea]|uniref:DUF4382 domain-containing protein n=1 Tax=Croceivirga lutea TaxID=1775167 RepID=UPI0019A88B7B|nr:DUF4382 domain-containing protein [Croceivirga lutea]GGG44993.1 hypothetical protein GCM10011414_13180 [Croceivirga lutea]
MMKNSYVVTFFIIITLLLIGCSEDGNTSTDENGKLTLRLTDAPFPYDLVREANVTIFKVEARRAEDDMETNEMDEGSPFITLMETDIDVNLLELTNGTTEMLADAEVPAGTYDLFRVYVKGVNVVLTDERVFDLKVPSGQQTGIKLFIKPAITVVGGLSSDLLLDFDVSRSFVAKGNINRVENINGFNFKPVIKVSNMSTTGTLMGNVSSMEDDMAVVLEGAQISIFAADTLNTTAFSDGDGNYAIMGLDSGTYKVFAEREGYASSDTLEVTISAANNSIQDFVLEATTTESGD